MLFVVMVTQFYINLKNGFTLQIGNLPMIRDLVNQTIVCDFRVQDVQLGGQGAPLVPIGDELFFSNMIIV